VGTDIIGPVRPDLADDPKKIDALIDGLPLKFTNPHCAAETTISRIAREHSLNDEQTREMIGGQNSKKLDTTTSLKDFD
jgi:hypothetical protein